MLALGFQQESTVDDLPEEEVRERLKAVLTSDRIASFRQQLLSGLTVWIRAHTPEEAVETFIPLGWSEFAIMCVERAHLTNALPLEELCHAWILIGGSFEVAAPGG